MGSHRIDWNNHVNERVPSLPSEADHVRITAGLLTRDIDVIATSDSYSLAFPRQTAVAVEISYSLTVAGAVPDYSPDSHFTHTRETAIQIRLLGST